MYPELFTIPFVNIPVHSYGLMMVLGLLLGMEVAKFLARRSGLNPELFATASVLALVSGLIGARIAFVLQNFSDFTGKSFFENVWDAVNLTSGGLVYYGGFLLAFPTLVIFAIKNKMPLFRSMDIIAPCLMIGLAFGRIGCFLNGCCGGQPCDLSAPLGVQFPYLSEAYMTDVAEHRVKPNPELYLRDPIDHTARLATRSQLDAHPELAAIAKTEHSVTVINTQLISTATALMIALITICFFTLYATPGRGFALMMMLEGISRTLIEGLRVEPNVIGSLTLSMLIGLCVCAGGVVLWFVTGALNNRGLVGERAGYPATVSAI